MERVKRLLVVVAGSAALFAAHPGHAQARECGLPNKAPVWVDFADGSVPYWTMFARPGIVGAAANFLFPAQMRALGEKTVYWDMYLRQRVGTPTNPLDPDIAKDWADRVFYRAVASSSLRDAVDRAQRAVGLEPRDTLVADEHAVPRQRPAVRASA